MLVVLAVAVILVIGLAMSLGPRGTVKRDAAVTQMMDAAAKREASSSGGSAQAHDDSRLHQQVRDGLAAGRWAEVDAVLPGLLRRSAHHPEVRLFSIRLSIGLGEERRLVEDVRNWFLMFGISPWTEASVPVLLAASEQLRGSPASWLHAFGAKRASEPMEVSLVRLSCHADLGQWAELASLLVAERDDLPRDERDYWEGWVNWQIGSRAVALDHWRALLNRHLLHSRGSLVEELSSKLPPEAWQAILEGVDEARLVSVVPAIGL